MRHGTSELANPRDLGKIFDTPEYAAWKSLHASEDSKYADLAMPRILARRPYGAKSNPVDGFDFEEDVTSASPDLYTWANSAYAMGVNINRSFKLYGWCSRIRGIESGGAVTGLATHTFPTDDGGVEMACPTEIGILPYLFATCRFAHYLKCIVRDKVGSFKSRDDMKQWLQDWVVQYADGDPAHSSKVTKAEKPLADAQVEVQEIESNPGYHVAQFFLRPHYQLEGLTVSLRLVSKLPSAKGG